MSVIPSALSTQGWCFVLVCATIHNYIWRLMPVANRRERRTFEYRHSQRATCFDVFSGVIIFSRLYFDGVSR
jgi:hypothetical protein